MTNSAKADGKPDVPLQVFKEFLQALSEAGAPVELVARFRKVLLEEKVFTERALKTAVFGEESLP